MSKIIYYSSDPRAKCQKIILFIESACKMSEDHIIHRIRVQSVRRSYYSSDPRAKCQKIILFIGSACKVSEDHIIHRIRVQNVRRSYYSSDPRAKCQKIILFIGSACKVSEDHIIHRIRVQNVRRSHPPSVPSTVCLLERNALYTIRSLDFRGLCLRQVEQPTKHGLLSAMNFGYFRHPIRGSRPSGYEF